MFRIDDPSASGTLPTPEAAGTEGYFTEGNPGVTNPTLVRASWLNMIQEELRNVVVAGGLTPSKTTYNQVLTAIQSLIAASAPPAGAVIYMAKNSAPSGYLKANGALVSRTTYASLFAAIGTTFGVGDGTTTFALPDLRGEFLRGWDDTRGIDTGRVFGSAQTDALQGHRHSVYADAIGTKLFNSGASSAGAFNRPQQGDGTGAEFLAKDLVSDGANGTPRSAAETRPRNIALLACIKY